jgi:simple sugar transport system substrate-binding protein
MAKFAPKSQLTAAINDWSGFYIDTVKAVMAGTWKPSQIHGGLKEGMVRMAPLNPVVPAAVVKVFEDKKKAMIAGTLTPFQGPLKDQSGALRVAAGADLAPAKILAMDFYVQGVLGTIPK